MTLSLYYLCSVTTHDFFCIIGTMLVEEKSDSSSKSTEYRILTIEYWSKCNSNHNNYYYSPVCDPRVAAARAGGPGAENMTKMCANVAPLGW